MSDCIFKACNLTAEDNTDDVIHKELQKQICELMNTTTAKLLLFEGKLAELCTYLKTNLNNTIRELLSDMKFSGELDQIINDAVNSNINTLLQKTEDFVTPKMFGCVGDGFTDDTGNMQKTIDYAIKHNKGVYIPEGKFLITDTLYLRGTVNMYGDGQASYNNKSMLLFDVGDKNIPLFKKWDGVPHVARCTFNNLTFARQRTTADGYDSVASPIAYGKNGVCFGFHLNETSVVRCSFIGFGFICERASITDFIDCDMSYCGTLISNTDICNAVSFYGCDIYASGNLLYANGNLSTVNFTNCWIEDYVTLLKTKGVVIMSLNFNGCTMTNKARGEDMIVYTSTPTFAREFINFTDCLLYIKGQICSKMASNVEFALTFNECVVHYGGTGETINIYGNSKFLTMSGGNDSNLCPNRGFDSRTNTAYTPITLAKATPAKKGEIAIPNNFVETKDDNGERLLMLPVYYETAVNPYNPRHFVFNTKAVKTGDWVLKFVYNMSSGDTIEKIIVTL